MVIRKYDVFGLGQVENEFAFLPLLFQSALQRRIHRPPYPVLVRFLGHIILLLLG